MLSDRPWSFPCVAFFPSTSKMPPKKQNPKAVAAMERKAVAQAEKDRQAAAAAERAEAEDWKKGSNTRKADKDAAVAAKEEERRRRMAENQAALEEDETATSGIKAAPKPKKKKKDDLSELTAALGGGNKVSIFIVSRFIVFPFIVNRLLGGWQMTKFEKQQAAKKKAKENARKKQVAEEAAAAERPVDPLAPAPLMENMNHLSLGDDVEEASGIEGAIEALSSNATVADKNPERRMKAAYLAFEEREMERMKEDHPGLKRSQYKERIFDLWKKSPENPQNQALAAAAAQQQQPHLTADAAGADADAPPPPPP